MSKAPSEEARDWLVKTMGAKDADILLARAWIAGFKLAPLEPKDLK